MRLRVAMVAFLLLASAARAQHGNTLELVLAVDHDGSAVAVEKFELAAPLHEPLRWRMPTASVTPLGVRRLLFVDILEVSDGRGNKVQNLMHRYGNALEVVIPVQPLADNTARITYEVRNAVRFRDQHDELFWHVGSAWSEPIARASLHVTVPPNSAGQLKAQLVHGGANALAVQSLPVQGTTVMQEIIGPNARPNEPVLDLVFAPGVLERPPRLRRAAWFVSANPIVLFPGVLLLFLWGFHKWSARGESAEVSVAPRYEPPENLSPTEAGYLIDGRLDSRDVAAMLLDLARRGFIRIEEGTPDEEIPYAGPDFILRLLKPMTDWAGALPYEHAMLFHTFYGGHWTKLSSLSIRFYETVPKIEQMIQDAMLEKQLYADPRRVAAQRLAAGGLLAALLWVAQAAGWFAVAESALLGVVVTISAVLIVILFTWGVSRRTPKGVRVLAELHGFQQFLNSVEADRMERVTPDLFERYLPYAVALGVEHRWGAAFSTISSGPPLWWNADKAGGFPDFVHGVAFSLAQRAARGRRESR